MRAGSLNRRITLERQGAGQDDDSGEEIGTWATLGRPWADIEPLTGRELVNSNLEMSKQPTRFRFRYSSTWSDLSARDRIVFNSTTYDIESVVPVKHMNGEFEVIGVVRG